ncbi:hypothetical protein IG631_07264 [Alternaria alternata]|nr:hypothetical protein IG631_07264 [Alternaria alternata]
MTREHVTEPAATRSKDWPECRTGNPSRRCKTLTFHW